MNNLYFDIKINKYKAIECKITALFVVKKYLLIKKKLFTFYYFNYLEYK